MVQLRWIGYQMSFDHFAFAVIHTATPIKAMIPSDHESNPSVTGPVLLGRGAAKVRFVFSGFNPFDN